MALSPALSALVMGGLRSGAAEAAVPTLSLRGGREGRERREGREEREGRKGREEREERKTLLLQLQGRQGEWCVMLQ